MGRSHLVDEISKDHFLIPINLREERSRGASDTILTLYGPIHSSSRLSTRRRCYPRLPHAI
ncbi:hypothetical protein BJV78DRAFT_1189800 [Lactifluus subvellereus]|nr:hypothetical protein BJV78DRAFT_1189800 [Lactifluus subvellereus]